MSDFKELLQAYDDANGEHYRKLFGPDDMPVHKEYQAVLAARAALVKCYDDFADVVKGFLYADYRGYDMTVFKSKMQAALDQDDKTKTDS